MAEKKNPIKNRIAAFLTKGLIVLILAFAGVLVMLKFDPYLF